MNAEPISRETPDPYCPYCGSKYERHRGCCGEVHECQHETGTVEDGMWLCDECEFTADCVQVKGD